MKRVSLKGIILPLLLTLVGASIAVGAYVTTTGGSIFELRKKAADTKGSQLVFVAPKQVDVGKPFTAELVLDTTGDPDYTVSGVDAVVSYGLQDIEGLTLLSAIPGKIFDSYPTQVPSPPAPLPIPSSPFTISGVKNYSINDKGYFNGFTGQGVFATLTFVAPNPGRATISLVYKDPSATDDTNINGFLASQPVSLQKPQERLLTAPQAFTVEVVASQPTPTVSPTPTPTPPQGCRYEPRPCAQPVGGVATGCGMELVCTTPTPTPTPEPRVMINFRLALEGRKNHTTVVDIYGMTTTNVQPSKEVLQALGAGGSTVVVGDRVDKLGTAVTDPSGTGVLSLDRGYAGGSYMILFAQTPSHLRKAAQNYQGIRLDVGQNPVCRAEICTQEVKYVVFDTLTAGDVYTDEKGNKDNLINTFDVGAIFAAWSGANVVANQRDQATFGGILPKEIGFAADLNGDGVVNNRDLAMLLANFNKRGDTSIPQ